jgi:hypothetical protein
MCGLIHILDMFGALDRPGHVGGGRMVLRFLRSLHVAVVAVVAAATGAGAQAPPGVPSPRDALCIRLESQLAALDRGIVDPADSEQIRRYEEAANRQQFELDRTQAQARRMGCEGSGFFLFRGAQPPQCDELNNQIQRMRANLGRILADLQRLQSQREGPEERRRTILAALAQNDCGPQYRTVAPARPGGIFDTLFSGRVEDGNAPQQSSTYRTLCVRTCDGFYFPISYATTPNRFRDDERTCQRLCPAAEVVLFSHRNPGEEPAQAVSINGQLYTELPNAFRYRQEYNPACTCKPPGQSWAEALRHADDGSAGSDLAVPEERTRARPQVEAPKPATGRSGEADSRKTAPQDASAAPTPPPPGRRNVRTVGPQFIPAR